MLLSWVTSVTMLQHDEQDSGNEGIKIVFVVSTYFPALYHTLCWNKLLEQFNVLSWH